MIYYLLMMLHETEKNLSILTLLIRHNPRIGKNTALSS